MAKGLLILIGGRPMPNILTIIHEKPDLIIALVSRDESYRVQQLQMALKELFGDESPNLDVSNEIDAFNVDQIYEGCLSVAKQYPDFEWIFNITCGTAIMSIGAYEAARNLITQGMSIHCWYLDTKHTNLVTLLGKGRDNDIFNISVEQYAATYGCQLHPGKLSNSVQASQWLPFVHFLINEPEYIGELQNMLAKSGLNGEAPGDNILKRYPIVNKAPLRKTFERSRLLAEAEKVNLISDLVEQGDQISFSLTDVQAHFLKGRWLEAYVWNEVAKKDYLSDYRWDLELFYAGLTQGKPGNQIDVSIIYKAQLFIIECKTGDSDFFEKGVLNELDSTAQILGKGFVGKLLVASWLEQPYTGKGYKKEQQDKIERFKERAKYLGIEIATRENLTEIGTIIDNLVKNRTRG